MGNIGRKAWKGWTRNTESYGQFPDADGSTPSGPGSTLPNIPRLEKNSPNRRKRNGKTRRFERGARKPRDNSGELLTTAVVIRKVCSAGGRHILGTLRNSLWRPSEVGQTPRRDARSNTA